MFSNIAYEKDTFSGIIIFDRDGTLIENIPYLNEISKIKFKKEIIKSLTLAQKNKFKLVVATNQSGINRGLVKKEKVDSIHSFISNELKKNGIILNQFIYCPHIPKDACKCRKPNNLMIEHIIEINQIERSKTFFVGDSISDAVAASKSSIKSFILDGLSYKNYLPSNSVAVHDLYEAIRIITQE